MLLLNRANNSAFFLIIKAELLLKSPAFLYALLNQGLKELEREEREEASPDKVREASV